MPKKLTWDNVRAIRAEWASRILEDPAPRRGPLTVEIGQRYGVSGRNIYHIVYHTTWNEPRTTVESTVVRIPGVGGKEVRNVKRMARKPE